MGARNHAGWVATVCGVALAAGLQLAPSAAASPTSDWGAQALGPAAEIQNAISALKTSADAKNLKGVKAACRQIQDSTSDLSSMLPAPNEALNDEVRAALSELRLAVRPCLGAGPNPTLNEITSAQMHLDKAIPHMEAARAIVGRG
jgi:hypothetical protein